MLRQTATSVAYFYSATLAWNYSAVDRRGRACWVPIKMIDGPANRIGSEVKCIAQRLCLSCHTSLTVQLWLKTYKQRHCM